MTESVRGKVKALAVATPQGPSGTLQRDSQLVFNYGTQDRQCEISLTMPLRAASYSSNQPHPIFAMNLPEGNLRERIKERYGKQFARLDDMAMLSIVGHDQIGRLTLSDATGAATAAKATIGLQELLRSQASDKLFDYLLDTYLASGISGIQPKVLIPDADAQPDGISGLMNTTARLSDLIVKTSGTAFPGVTQNEFLCMDAAKRAGIDVPDFYLSDDASMFVVRRFDRDDQGQRLGFEDMSVLLGKKYDEYGHYKYGGNYESIPTAIELLCGPNAGESKVRFFEYFAATCMMRNGDAHLKNFGLLYESPGDQNSVRLSPMFDVVTTSVYDSTNARTGQVVQDRELALNLNKSKSYPDHKALVEFGARCNVMRPELVLQRIDAGMTASLEANRDRVSEPLWRRMKQEWDNSRLALQAPPKPVRISSLGNRQAYKQALALESAAAPAWSADQERRAAMLEGIKGMATGALLSFAEHATQAIERAGGAAKVDWHQVEDVAMAQSLHQDHQAADDVYRAIAGASPGSVGDAALASLKARVEHAAKTHTQRPGAGPDLSI